MRPSFLSIKSIACHATEDTLGSDDLYAVLGPERIELGSFTAGDVSNLDLEMPIPEGVAELRIFEHDDLDPNDLLGTIDLTQDMDMERVFGILEGDARYDITFLVVAAGEDIDALRPRCGGQCPECSGSCIRDLIHTGQHWCGRHGWG